MRPHRLDAVAARAREAPRIDPRHAQAAIVENKREDLARDAARLERLEKKMEGAVRGVRRRRRHDESSPLAPLADNEKLRDSEDADVTDEMKNEARNYVATNSGQ